METYKYIKPLYIPIHFEPYEVVNKGLYKRFGSNAYRFLDWRVLTTADKLRERYGKMICNDWYWGGQFDSRGYRVPNDPDGAELSAHKRGLALDLIPRETTAEKIRQDIKKDKYPEDFQYITIIEDGVNWLHFSCENVQKLTVISP